MLYIVIDTTTIAEAKVVAVAKLVEAGLIGRIQKASGRTVIAPPLEARGFTNMPVEQLQYLYWNTMQLPPPAEYADLVKAMQAAAELLPVDATPVETLEREVARLYPDEPGQRSDKPKEPRAPGEPHERPKGTSTTGRVWEVADAQFAALSPANDATNADWKAIRTAIVAACEAEGINKATAATQYSKWKATKLIGGAA
jgi:hypothetical protein